MLLGTAAVSIAIASMLSLGAASPESSKCEYKVENVSLDPRIQASGLNDLGKEGWELVAVAGRQQTQSQLYLKRSMP